MSTAAGSVVLGAACAIFDPEGRVLLVRHDYGELNWELPGGRALRGEDPLTTARRELREETALDLLPASLAGVYFEPAHELGPSLHFVFRLRLARDVTPRAVPPEISNARFWPLGTLPRPLSDFHAPPGPRRRR